eukprot:3835893-Rhodomonas_salina.5
MGEVLAQRVQKHTVRHDGLRHVFTRDARQGSHVADAVGACSGSSATPSASRLAALTSGLPRTPARLSTPFRAAGAGRRFGVSNGRGRGVQGHLPR